MLLKLNKNHISKLNNLRHFSKQNKSAVSQITDRIADPKKQQAHTFQKIRSFFADTFQKKPENKNDSAVNEQY